MAPRNFTMQGLWSLAAWGATAACALLIAVLATRGETAAPNAEIAAASPSAAAPASPAAHHASVPPRASFDAQAETRRLAESVRELAAESDEIKSRVAVVEQSMDDVTGSITKDIAAAKSAAAGGARPPWPGNQPPLPPTTAAIAAVLAPGLPMPTEYGVDVGGALNIPTLRARWVGLRTAHPDLFDGLRPVITLRQATRSRVELRLVVGPLASAEAAAELCGYLLPYRMFCQPTLFGGQHLALD